MSFGELIYLFFFTLPVSTCEFLRPLNKDGAFLCVLLSTFCLLVDPTRSILPPTIRCARWKGDFSWLTLILEQNWPQSRECFLCFCYYPNSNVTQFLRKVELPRHVYSSIYCNALHFQSNYLGCFHRYYFENQRRHYSHRMHKQHLATRLKMMLAIQFLFALFKTRQNPYGYAFKRVFFPSIIPAIFWKVKVFRMQNL